MTTVQGNEQMRQEVDATTAEEVKPVDNVTTDAAATFSMTTEAEAEALKDAATKAGRGFVAALAPTVASLEAQLIEVGAVQGQLLEMARAQERDFLSDKAFQEAEQMFLLMPRYQQKLRTIQSSMTELQRRSTKLRALGKSMDKDIQLREQRLAAQHARAVLKANGGKQGSAGGELRQNVGEGRGGGAGQSRDGFSQLKGVLPRAQQRPPPSNTRARLGNASASGRPHNAERNVAGGSGAAGGGKHQIGRSKVKVTYEAGPSELGASGVGGMAALPPQSGSSSATADMGEPVQVVQRVVQKKVKPKKTKGKKKAPSSIDPTTATPAK